jgi:hypothetical protein
LKTPLLIAAAVAACQVGTPGDPGVVASLRVASATFFAGAPPAADVAGPKITEYTSLNNTIHPGEIGKHLSGRMGPDGQALLLALDGDAGYWVIPAEAPDTTNPGDLLWDATISFARDLPPGPHALSLSAVTADGAPGPASVLALTATDAPAGRSLDVGLTWDTESDLDLHVELPSGVIVWADNINSATTSDPAAVAAGGILDFDSNSQCVIDGRREEHVYWTEQPPVGTYAVRVDAFSMCGQPAARWTTVVTYEGAVMASATGQCGDADTLVAHDAKAGTLALTFEVK